MDICGLDEEAGTRLKTELFPVDQMPTIAILNPEDFMVIMRMWKIAVLGT